MKKIKIPSVSQKVWNQPFDRRLMPSRIKLWQTLNINSYVLDEVIS